MDDSRQAIKQKLRQYFDGKIVRKDLTKHIKEGANVPVYVLEFLLEQYCSSDDDDIIKEDRYEAEFSNLGVKNIPIYPDYPSKYDRLLCGGIWCILQLDYEFIEEDKKNTTPIRWVN